MTIKDKESLVKLLKKLKKDYPEEADKRSTVNECVDFLLSVIGVKI